MFNPYYGRWGDIRVDLRKARLARRRPSARPKSQADIEREKAVRRRRYAAVTGTIYVGPNEARKRRKAAFRKLERVLLDTSLRAQPPLWR